MSKSAVAEHIRREKRAIAQDWERLVVADLAELARLERGALIDHLPEVLDGLAAWIEGDTEAAKAAFSALADGHALQRLGFGIELAALNVEYKWLRSVLLKHLLVLPSSLDVREQLIRLNEGLDHAIHFAVRRYTEQRDYIRDRFIGILGHDLRDPLSSADMAARELLRSAELSAVDRKKVCMIERAVLRMERMVGDVLDFARGHLAGGIPVVVADADLGEICATAADETKGAHPQRCIEVKMSGDLCGRFDRDRVLQVVGNLLSNAIHHGEDPIVLEAWEAEDHRAVFTRVSNRGAPIAPAMVAKMFEPFVHAGDAKKGSLGLGLFIVAQIVRAHGATHEVSSSGGMTQFTIRWPRTPRAEVPQPP
ncbi:MAG TPA: HAMP domain-containing sensor histidine kinase [Polyangiaceae bacterium]|nr:HAMP domain-containing sensor histidine kinase [Polyangiaceae bacterium]